jgi:molybdopterin synthase catalytic subunit
MIKVTEKALHPEQIIAIAKSDGSGCVVTYVGLIRDVSHGKPVLSVEYEDAADNAKHQLEVIANEAGGMWHLENLAIYHRIGKLKVGDINLVIAVATAHRSEGFEACQYVIDQFKQRLPTRKTETYRDGTTLVREISPG